MISLAHLHGTLPGEAVRWTMVGHVEMGHTHQSSTDWAGPLQSGGNRSTGLHSTGGSSYHSSSHHFTSHRLTWLTQSWPGQILANTEHRFYHRSLLMILGGGEQVTGLPLCDWTSGLVTCYPTLDHIIQRAIQPASRLSNLIFSLSAPLY